MNRVIGLLLGTAICSVSTTAYSATRNCTPDEKALADEQLKVLSDDTAAQSGLVAKHLPFGVHETAGNDSGEQLLYQNAYIMLHDEDLKTSLWTSHRLTGQDRLESQNKDRVECFRRDPRLKKSRTAIKADYNEAIYDQGHLANDADMKDNLIEQLNTYVLSNMSPQHCAFNRGIWLSLEHLTRSWAESDHYGEIYVTSGAIFDRDGVVGRDLDVDARRMESRNNGFRVGVPSHYYKVILRQEEGVWHGISFLLNHDNDLDGVSWDDVRPDVEPTITSIESIETKAGIRLHPDLNREELVQYSSGDDWDLSLGKANFAAALKEGVSCVDTLPQ